MENKKLWFRAKRYGWGWIPCSWQGWLILFAYCMGIAFIADYSIQKTVNSLGGSETFLCNYIPALIVLSIPMIWICYKTGEKPRWRWG